MVLRSLEKLGGDSKTPCAHSGDSVRDDEFNSYVSCFLILIKAFSMLVAHTFSCFICPLISVGDEWEGGRLHSGPNLPKFVPLTHNQCHCL